MSIGQNIRRLRELHNMTQAELAQAVCVSQPMITQIERGTKTPTMLLGNDIAQVLGCTLDELIKAS